MKSDRDRNGFTSKRIEHAVRAGDILSRARTSSMMTPIGNMTKGVGLGRGKTIV